MDIDRVRIHLKELFEARGEDVVEFEEHGNLLAEVENGISKFYNELIELNTNRTCVFFCLTKEILKELLKNMKDLESATAIMKKHSAINFMIIVMDPPSTPTMNILMQWDKKFNAEGGMLQVFQMKELLYNPTRHILVPKHEKLSEEEVKKLMEEYMIKNKYQMPLIHRNDVIARWLGLRHGDIVRITRYNDTSGEYYYYRCCL